MIDAYKIGVNIAFASNGTTILETLLQKLLGVDKAAKLLKGNLAGVKGAALGAIGAFVGFSGIKAIADVIGDARELNRQLEATKQLGGDFLKTIDATRTAAFGAAGSTGVLTAADAVRLNREIGVTLGNPATASDMLPEAAKAAYVVSHYTGEGQEEIIKNLVRVADARGQIFSKGADGQEHVDPAKLSSELEAAAKGLILGGGFITSRDLLQEARQAGPAAKTQSAESFYTAMTELAVAMGASKAGTAEMGLFSEFIGGTMSKKVAEHLTEAGFLKPGDWHSGGSGGVVVNPGVASRYNDLTNDPAAYFSTGPGANLIQSYAQKEGITAMQAVFQLFGRQTVERLVSDFMTNRPQIERARAMAGAIPSVSGQFAELQGNDLGTNILSFNNAWTSLMQALGEAGIPAAILIMHGLTGALHAMTDVLVAHPWVGTILLGLAAGLSALLAVGGTLTVISFALGSTGLAVALGGLASGVATFATGGAAFTALGSAVVGIGALAAALWPLALAATAAAAVYAVFRMGSTPALITSPDHPGMHMVSAPRMGAHWMPNAPGYAPPASALPSAAAASNTPIPVHVTNTGDIAKGANTAMTRQLARPDPGPTGGDSRDSNPFGGFGAGP